MDAVELRTFVAELQADGAALKNAADKATHRLGTDMDGALEACGFELNRFYNILEHAFERICEAFENRLARGPDYHARLLQRMVLMIPDVRPAFLPLDATAAIRDLRGFRHLFRHAYEVELRRDRLEELADMASDIAGHFPAWIDSFEVAVRGMHGIDR